MPGGDVQTSQRFWELRTQPDKCQSLKVEPQLLLLLLAVNRLDPATIIFRSPSQDTLAFLCFGFHCAVGPDCQEFSGGKKNNTKHMVGVELIHTQTHMPTNVKSLLGQSSTQSTGNIFDMNAFT